MTLGTTARANVQVGQGGADESAPQAGVHAVSSRIPATG